MLVCTIFSITDSVGFTTCSIGYLSFLLVDVCICSSKVSSSICIAWLLIVIGICDKVLFSNLSICSWKPLERDKIRAIPIIPIEAAKAVRKVLPFLVLMLLNDKWIADK